MLTKLSRPLELFFWLKAGLSNNYSTTIKQQNLTCVHFSLAKILIVPQLSNKIYLCALNQNVASSKQILTCLWQRMLKLRGDQKCKQTVNSFNKTPREK